MKKKELFLLSIGIFLTVITWLIADIIHTSTEDKIKSRITIPNLKQYKIDKNIFTILEQKNQ